MSYGDSVKYCLHNSRVSELWEKIKEARTGAGLTQEQIGAACGGITRNAVSLWETEDEEKRTSPPVDKLQILAAITGRPMAWFFENDKRSAELAELSDGLNELQPEQLANFIEEILPRLPDRYRVRIAQAVLAGLQVDT